MLEQHGDLEEIRKENENPLIMSRNDLRQFSANQERGMKMKTDFYQDLFDQNYLANKYHLIVHWIKKCLIIDSMKNI